MSNFRVNLPLKDAADIVSEYVRREGLSTTCVGSYSKVSPDGRGVVMFVFDKYFMRVSSRASLTVILENLDGVTSVYSVGAGGGKGALFDFDWGAGDSFASLVEHALEGYIIR